MEEDYRFHPSLPFFGKPTIKRIMCDLYIMVLCHVVLIATYAREFVDPKYTSSNVIPIIGIIGHSIFTLIYCGYFTILVYIAFKTGNLNMEAPLRLRGHISWILLLSFACQASYGVLVILKYGNELPTSDNRFSFVIGQVILGLGPIAIAVTIVIMGTLSFCTFIDSGL